MSGFWMDVDGTTIHVNGDDTPEVRAAMADLIRAVRSGDYDNPDDPEGPPIPFTGPNPDYGAVRDYFGRALSTPADEPPKEPR